MSVALQIVIGVATSLISVAAVFIAKSTNDLNIKLAVVVERVDSHEKRLNKLEV